MRAEDLQLAVTVSPGLLRPMPVDAETLLAYETLRLREAIS